VQEKQQEMKEKGMKKTEENIEFIDDELLSEYQIDYSKVKRNPYFTEQKCFVEIDIDLVKAFESSENINEILRSILKAIPKKSAAIF